VDRVVRIHRGPYANIIIRHKVHEDMSCNGPFHVSHLQHVDLENKLAPPAQTSSG